MFELLDVTLSKIWKKIPLFHWHKQNENIYNGYNM